MQDRHQDTRRWPEGEDARQAIQRAWGERLYLEYDNILFHFRIRLTPPLIRVEPLQGSWGQWRPHQRTIVISRALIEAYSWDVVIEILKHEMAHQMVSEHGGGGSPHGSAFYAACQQLGVAAWAAAASGELPERIPNWRERSLSSEEESLLKRAEKLLALAASTNEHEAALAMERVRQLYAKYNLQRLQDHKNSEHVYCIIDLKQKRIGADDSMIFSILNEHFFVRCIFTNRYDANDLCDYKVVEVLGTPANVEMAEYVYFFLRQQLDSLWRQYQKHANAGGRSKRSYRLGVLTGFRAKLKAERTPGDTAGASHNRALVKVADGQLEDFLSHRHPRLSSRRAGAIYGDTSSFNAGRADGGKVTLHRGIGHHDGQRGYLLSGGKS